MIINIVSLSMWRDVSIAAMPVFRRQSHAQQPSDRGKVKPNESLLGSRVATNPRDVIAWYRLPTEWPSFILQNRLAAYVLLEQVKKSASHSIGLSLMVAE